MEVNITTKTTISQNGLTVSKGHSDIERMLKLPLEKKVKVVRILREHNHWESVRKKQSQMQYAKDNRSHLKPLTDDEFFKMLK